MNPETMRNYRKVNYTGRVEDLLDLFETVNEFVETNGSFRYYSCRFRGEDVCLQVDTYRAKTRFSETDLPNIAILWANGRKIVKSTAGALERKSAEQFRKQADEYLELLRARKVA